MADDEYRTQRDLDKRIVGSSSDDDDQPFRRKPRTYHIDPVTGEKLTPHGKAIDDAIPTGLAAIFASDGEGGSARALGIPPLTPPAFFNSIPDDPGFFTTLETATAAVEDVGKSTIRGVADKIENGKDWLKEALGLKSKPTPDTTRLASADTDEIDPPGPTPAGSAPRATSSSIS